VKKNIIKNLASDNIIKIPNTDFIYFQDFKLGEGTFGTVFYGLNNKIKQEVAIKLYSEKNNEINIDFECCLCKDFETLNLAPKIYYFSLENKICVQSLLGPNLETLFNFSKRKFDIKTISFIGIELINRIEELHKLGYVHRDIKPKNIVWLNFSDYESILKNNLILIDFGLAGPYVSKNNKHLPFIAELGHIGTHYFSSVNSSRGNSQSRRDDIESIFYCLVYFFKGKLPWESPNKIKEGKKSLQYNPVKLNVKNNLNNMYNMDSKKNDNNKLLYKKEIERLLLIKENIKPSILCKDMPNEYKVIYCYIKNIAYSEKPDYNIIRLLLRNVVESEVAKKKKLDYNKFIWEKIIKDMLKSKKNKVKNFELIKDILFPGYPIKIEKITELLNK
jgi:serine/threonine protein kinase